MKPKRRNGRDDAEAALRMQLGFAEAMLASFAKGTEAWRLMWGRWVDQQSKPWR
jgi:hypothetical protein